MSGIVLWCALAFSRCFPSALFFLEKQKSASFNHSCKYQKLLGITGECNVVKKKTYYLLLVLNILH